ncbi:MAG TPA: hypothetical protein VGZ25_17055 [Gemmataceae bacterium]|nr:hypothetical protein [Gemmataceae bacterium]
MTDRFHHFLTYAIYAMLVLTGITTSLPAQPPPPPSPIRLKVQPAAAPKPALKYKLLPELEDKTPGNAALLYLGAFSPEWYSHKRQPGYPGFLDLIGAPLADFPKKDLKWLLDYGPLKQLDKAAHKETCDWEMTSRVREEGITLLIPHVQGFRELTSLIALRTRLHMAEGNFDQAVNSLQTGFSLGRDLGQSPMLVNYLVGVAFCQIMIQQLEDLIQQPKSPNLYWALGYLPNPLIDLRKAYEGERMTLLAAVPELRTIESESLTPEREEKLMDQLCGLARLSGEQNGREECRIILTVLALKIYPEAKKALIEGGRKAGEVEAMPVLQVVSIHSMRQFLEHQDDVFKWLSLPIPEAKAGLEQSEKRLRAAIARKDTLPLFSLIPGMAKVYDAHCRLARRLAALRCLEAIRMHAKENKGKPPAKLEDITLVPAPMDPVTGKSFEYFVKDQTIILKAPPPAQESANQSNSFTYEMTIDS